MAEYDILCPVVARETVEMEKKERRKWVPFLVEILWVRETAARNEYVMRETRVHQKEGLPFCDHFGFGKAVTGAAANARNVSKNYMLDQLKPEWELVVKARSRDVPFLAHPSLDACVIGARPPGRSRYLELPTEWRVKASRKPLVAVERTPELVVWSSLASEEENKLTVEAFMAGEIPSSEPDIASVLVPAPSPR